MPVVEACPNMVPYNLLTQEHFVNLSHGFIAMGFGDSVHQVWCFVIHAWVGYDYHIVVQIFE